MAEDSGLGYISGGRSAEHLDEFEEVSFGVAGEEEAGFAVGVGGGLAKDRGQRRA